MLLGPLQENLIVLLSFDDTHSPIIRSAVDINLYGGQYRVIAARIYDFIDKYKKPPKDHLPDILTDKLESENKREAELYADVLESMHAAYKGINKEYVMTQLETFIERQTLRAAAVDITKALQRDTEESIDEAKKLFAEAQTRSLKIFNPGLRLSDKKNALNFLDIHGEAFPTGIAELDKRGFGPTRKELYLIIANAKRGKSWALIHMAKMALVHRLKVCHISLEMSCDRTAQRYFQTLFAMAKRDEALRTATFETDQLDRITGFGSKTIRPKLTLQDPDILVKLERQMNKSKRMLENIFIKDFPTGQLTITQLEAYLNNLEATEHFVPDLLVIDYPDLMKLDKNNYRLAVDETYKDIRGLLVKRNIAGVVVSQAHRSSAKTKQVGGENVAEAYSKIAHADCVITYSQTDDEHAVGLARLKVDSGRNDADKIVIVITQLYAIGGFALNSHLMRGKYWESLPKGEEAEGE